MQLLQKLPQRKSALAQLELNLFIYTSEQFVNVALKIEPGIINNHILQGRQFIISRI